MKNLRKMIVGIVALMEVMFSMAYNTQVYAAPTIEETILTQVNSVREERGLKKLTVNAELTKAAKTRANESSLFYSHKRPNGTEWYTVNNSLMGETLYRGSESFDPNEYCVSMWKDSKVHYEIMTLDNITSAGIAVCYENGTYYVAMVVA